MVLGEEKMRKNCEDKNDRYRHDTTVVFYIRVVRAGVFIVYVDDVYDSGLI